MNWREILIAMICTGLIAGGIYLWNAEPTGPGKPLVMPLGSFMLCLCVVVYMHVKGDT